LHAVFDSDRIPLHNDALEQKRTALPAPAKIGQQMSMTYEQYLDEIATLIHEKYDVSEADAIKFVVRAQAGDFFSLHDDTPAMRTQEQAELDAKTVYEQRNKSNPKVFRK
jgi:predicted Rossmann fold nucleotide-binding protein DprA/Smf involved in DNA uptake